MKEKVMSKRCNESRSEHNRGPWCTRPEGHTGPCSWDEAFESNLGILRDGGPPRSPEGLTGGARHWHEKMGGRTPEDVLRDISAQTEKLEQANEFIEMVAKKLGCMNERHTILEAVSDLMREVGYSESEISGKLGLLEFGHDRWWNQESGLVTVVGMTDDGRGVEYMLDKGKRDPRPSSEGGSKVRIDRKVFARKFDPIDARIVDDPIIESSYAVLSTGSDWIATRGDESEAANAFRSALEKLSQHLKRHDAVKSVVVAARGAIQAAEAWIGSRTEVSADSDEANVFMIAVEVFEGEVEKQFNVGSEEDSGGSGRFADDDWKALDRETVKAAKMRRIYESFVNSWLNLPPLVRASAGASLLVYIDRLMNSAIQDVLLREHDMPRRSKVSMGFVTAFDVFREFVVALTNHADDEAVASGIDADIYPEPTAEALTRHLVRQSDAREREATIRAKSYVAKAIQSKVSDDVDQEVLAGIADDEEG